MRPAKWSTRSFCITAPRPDSISRSSTPRSSNASPRFPRKSAAWPRACCSTRRPRTFPRTIRDAELLKPRPRTGGSSRVSKRSRSISFTSRPSRALSRSRQAGEKEERRTCRSTQRLANYIIEGTKDGLIADLDRKRAEGAAPLDIINGPLMAGMSRGGPAVQQQRADRRRGAAVGRGDEGGGQSSRAVHGEGRHRRRAARSFSRP